jgi:CheY-like chemotaxis protein
MTPRKRFDQKMTAEILLVDDNAIQATTRRAILERAGRSVVVASGAAQALQMLEDEDLLHSLGMIITDHLMPGLNGPQFIEKLRQQMPKIPVLVLSGLADAEVEYEGMHVVFRVKPFPPDMLISLTSAILDEPIGRSA